MDGADDGSINALGPLLSYSCGQYSYHSFFFVFLILKDTIYLILVGGDIVGGGVGRDRPPLKVKRTILGPRMKKPQKPPVEYRQPLTPPVFQVLLSLADGDKHGYA